MEPHKLSPGPVVVVIGAGFGGILSAIHLKEKLGFNNFLVVEKGDNIGGTWRDNTYPGCRSDISSYFYSFSTDLKHDWDNMSAGQLSILTYMKDVVRNHNLGPHILLNTEVLEAEWVESAQAYTLMIQNDKGIRSTLTANIVISAVGVLHIPRMPNIPGLETFKGKLFHSSRWDTSVSLVGKRVAVIGNGSTGSQIMIEIPKIDGIQVTQFFRTRNWILPGLNSPAPEMVQWLLMKVPFIARLWRWLFFWSHELMYLVIFKHKWTRSQLKKIVSSYMLKRAPKKYHKILIPDFPVGCRRIVYSPEYLKALHRPNVDLRATGVAEICPEGIITSDGEKLPFDVIVSASGFVANKYFIPIRGRNGDTIQEYYDKSGGPNAYLGTTVPGFPNFLMLAGPNSVTGHTSVVFFEEIQMSYIGKIIAPVLNGIATSFDITDEANDQYNKTVQEKLKDTVFPFHNSWYHVNFEGRNSSIFPRSGIMFWWMCMSVNWAHYKVTGLRGSVADLNLRSHSDNAPLFIASGVVVALLAIWELCF